MKLSSLGYLVKEGFRNVWNNRIMSIASVCVLISCLVLTGSAVVFSFNVSDLVARVGDKNETTVHLSYELSEVEAAYIGKDIRKIDNVEAAEFYSKDEAFKEYKKKLGEKLFAYMDEDNPLNDAYKVRMKDLSKYDETVKEILKIKGVDEVSGRSELASRLTAINELVRTLSMFIVLALAVISLFIISNTIRATMYSRRFEISIMKSVGATDSFVRIPFIVEGMIIGFIASAISTAALIFLYDGIMSIVSHLIPFTAIPIEHFIWQTAGLFVAAGMFIGAVSGFISIRKYLKKTGNEILGW